MRKLTWAAMAYTAALLLMHYVLPEGALFVIVPVCAVIGIVSALLLRGRLRTGLLIICAFMILGAARYELQMYTKIHSVEPLIGQDIRITAIVTEYPDVHEDYTKLTVRLKTDLIPKIKVVLYDYSDSGDSCLPGDRIRATVRFSSALVSAGQETDTYISKGIYLRGYITEDVKHYGQDSLMLLYYPQYWGQWIRSTLNTYMSERSAAFLNALLTGNKAALYEDASLNNTLTRAGIAHVVAVSGLHVSFVLGVAMLLFGNRRGWVASTVMMILFAVMTGLSPSVMRAVFMQLLFLLAPVLRRESDGLTSISFALLILLLVNPFAVSSLGLQLSFLSMAGIVVLTPRISEWFERKCPISRGFPLRAYQFVSASLAASLGATLFTAPVCAFYFGNIAVLSPLTNLLVLWIVPYCFTGGFLLCGCSLLSEALAGALAPVLDLGVSFIYGVAKLIAATPMAAVYLPDGFMLAWFMVVYSVIGLMFFFKRQGLYRPLVPILTAAVTLFGLYTYSARCTLHGLTVAAVDVGQGQCVVATEGDYTLMVDCGGAYDAGDRAVRWLYEHGRTKVDVLVLTHFDEDHVNGVEDLMTQIPVEEIIFSGIHLTESDRSLITKLSEQARVGGTELTLVNSMSERHLGNMRLNLFLFDGDDSNDGIMALVQSNGFSTLIMGDADFEAEKDLLRSPMITDGDCLVVGHHGSKTSTSDALLTEFDPEYAIISCGYNRYGHPTEEVLDRLMSRNVVIYRTDQMGNVEVKVR